VTVRLPRLMPDDMTAEQHEIYEKFSGGERAGARSAFSLVHPEGGLIGPPSAWLLSPPLARVFEQAGAAMRFQLSLPPRSIEIALLLHAFGRSCAFEIYAHRKAGRAAGLTEAEIDGLASRRPPAFEDDAERVVFDTTLALLDRKALSAAEFDSAEAVLGARALFELVSLIGYYDMVATQLTVFEIDPPQD